VSFVHFKGYFLEDIMSRNMKIVLGIIGGIVICCTFSVIAAVVLLPRLASTIAEESFIEDAEQAAEVGKGIVDYNLPNGYAEEGGMSILGIDMVFAASADANEGVIMLMSFPESLAGNEAEMQSQMEQTFRRQSGRQNIHLIYKGEEEVTINGEAATLSVYEGTDERGVDVRQITGIFQTKSEAPGMLMILAPLDSWEDAGFDDFLASME